MVVDGVSWRIIIPDLVVAWNQVVRGERPALPEVGTSMRRWAHALAQLAKQEELLYELPIWRKIIEGPDRVLGSRPLDPAVDLASYAEEIELSLTAAATAALVNDAPKLFHGSAHDALLAGLALAYTSWWAQRGIRESSILIQLEGHGREESLVPGADLSHTVGWFTSAFPVRLELGDLDIENAFSGGPAAGLAIKRTKEQLAAIPNKGVGYGILRYLNNNVADELEHRAQIGFNYLGRVSSRDIAEDSEVSGWMPSDEFSELDGALDSDMSAMSTVEVNALVVDGRLTARVGYIPELISPEDAQNLIDLWSAALDGLAHHIASPEAGGWTPSDFSLVSVSQEEIEEWEVRYPSLTDIWPVAPLQAG